MRAAIILAAGRGRRLGMGPKAFATLNDETFLARGVRMLEQAGITDRVAVVPVGTSDQVVDAIAVENAHRDRGPLWSIVLGLRALSDEVSLLVVHHVDHPMVSPSTLQTLLRAAETCSPQVARVVPRYTGRRGHPIVVTRAGITALKALDEVASTTLRDVLLGAGSLLEVEVDDAYVLRNINTQRELEACSSTS